MAAAARDMVGAMDDYTGKTGLTQDEMIARTRSNVPFYLMVYAFIVIGAMVIGTVLRVLL
jgi:hypothetical protein